MNNLAKNPAGESIEAEKKKLQWGGAQVTKGPQTVLSQLKVLSEWLTGGGAQQYFKNLPPRKRWLVIAGAIVIGIIAWNALFQGGGRNCIASAFGYPPTCSDDPQDEERTEFNRGGDGTCKTTVVNGRNIGKCLQVTSDNECIPC
jgi:hypothetical protein